MRGRPAVDPRRAAALTAELERRAVATLAGDGRTMPVGQVAKAMLGIAGRIGEEVTRRLDSTPGKQEDNFFTAMGLGRDPARPARVPVAFKLADPAPPDIAAPRGTRLAAETDGPPIMFETERGIVLAPGSISVLAAVDAATDSIFLSPGGVAGGDLPRPAPVRRSVRGGAAAGASRLQISPASGVETGAVLSLGAGEAARQYRVTAVEGELLTIEPPLESALASGDPAFAVTDFEPFGGTSRNRQLHALYLGHRTLLDVPSKLSITVTGAPLPAETIWSWWGKTSDEAPAAWQPLEPEDAGGRLQLGKEKGKPVEKEIGGKESLWLRAELPNASAGFIAAQNIRIAITNAGVCQVPHEDRCKPPGPGSVEFEAVVNSTAIVPNSPFHPFGREPRLFDSFYIGCAEAFSKKRAEVSLCFELGGPKLGPLAAIEHRSSLQAFGVGTDGILYRGRFSADGGQLLQVPPPRQERGRLPAQAPVAARLTRTTIDVAVACLGEVQLATFPADSKLDPASVQWAQLPLLAEDAGKLVEQVAIRTEAVVQTEPAIGVVYARVGTRLLRWTQSGESFQCVLDDPDTAGLTELAGTDSLLTVGVETGGQRRIMRRTGSTWTLFATVPAADLPESGFIASTGVTSGSLVLAGYVGPEETPKIRIVRVGSSGAATDLGVFRIDRRLPLAFEPVHEIWAADQAPDLVVATDPPLRYLWYNGSYHLDGDEPPVGPSDNGSRHFVHGGGYVAVQASEFGLLYREAPLPFDARIGGLSIMADAHHVPASAAYATFGGPAAGPAYALFPSVVASAAPRLLVKIIPPGKLPPDPQGNARLYRVTGTSGDVTRISSKRIKLENIGITTDVDVAFYRTNDADDPLALPDEGIWRLQFSSIKAGVSRWKLTAAMPDPSPGDLRFRLLLQEVDGAGTPAEGAIDQKEVAMLAEPAKLQARLKQGPLASRYDPAATIAPAVTVGGLVEVMVFPHHLVEVEVGVGFVARLVGQPKWWSWSSIGPNQPANPALSWEYWNGQSWWALGTGNLTDSTANLLFGGGVFFDVPGDIAKTEVAGRENYWIRARLSGGDYGEAKVTSVSHPDTPEAGKTSQTIERDSSTIRAPYVTSLKVGFCARQPMPPEIVLTLDNLGIVNRTGANDAEMEIPVFTSVAELMNPGPPREKAAVATSDACGEPCPLPPAEIAEPDPCEAPGASDRCDNPCLGDDAPGAGSSIDVDVDVDAPFSRGLLIGFDKAFRADPLALYFDVGRGQRPARLRADLLRNGRFERVEIVKDTTYGLSEPGTLCLSCPQPPDEAELAGVIAHWLRIAPDIGDSNWAPRLRGVYLNAVEALSIETRALESLGHSSGSPDQTFRLSRAPVQASSLVLRVREDVSDEEAAAPGFDVVPAAGEMPGPWVAWRHTEDLAGEGPDARAFELDQQTGLLAFGNGRNGAIPPLGSEILAVSFAYVQGAGGNKVPAGGTLQLVSPVAGVEKVVALTAGAGGSDVEPPEVARRRAPAKLRHGGRILTLADLEDFATAFSPAVAQVRAQCRGGAVRLVVAANGGDPSPAPALLRALARAATEDGAYGLRRAGGLTAVPPALLPISVELLLDPDESDAFPELAAEARMTLAALCDPATGGLDGTGWRIGAVPTDEILSAALEAVASRANIARLAILRLDREEPQAPPAAIGDHVLVTLAAADVHVDQVREAAQ